MINDIFKKLLVIFLVVLIPVSTFAKDLCSSNDKGYTVGYFNGMWTTKLQAENELLALRDSFYGSSYKGASLDYELLYNQTSMKKEGGYSVSMLEDLAEVFDQRAREAGSVLKDRWEIFWETLSDSPKPKKKKHRGFFGKIIDKISSVSKAFTKLVSSFIDAVLTKVTTFITHFLGNPPTQFDYKTHNTRLKSLFAEGRKILLVAHSQGNLFANQAYDSLIKISKASKDNVKVVHIAPASVKTNGEHILANIDLVINALRLQGFTSVPSINVTIPSSHLKTDDYTGHMLIATYLNPKRDAVDRVGAKIGDALDLLVSPVSQANGGFFSATLTWDGLGDLDLSVDEPDNTHITHQNPKGISGIIDMDNWTSYGPEHYITTCDSQKLMSGIYKIYFNHYRGAEGRKATLQIATDRRGVIYTKVFDVGEATDSDGIDNPSLVVDVEVKEVNGDYFVDIVE